MRRLTNQPTVQDMANLCGRTYSAMMQTYTAMRKQGCGDDIRDPAKLLAWWRKNKRNSPPAGLIAAVEGDKKKPRQRKPALTEEESDPNAISEEETMDIEQAAEAQRRNFTHVQRRLEAVQKKGSDDAIEMWQGRLDKTALSLARLEKIAKEVRVADARWVPMDSVRDKFNELHTGLNERLFAVAERFANDVQALRAAWDIEVADLLADPFGK